MSGLIRGGAVVANGVVHLDDEAMLPAVGAITVTLARWQADAPELRAAADLLIGVRLPNTVDVEDTYAGVADRKLLVLEFPGFGDGRAYSQARVLRERCGYAGELRARGAAVVRDQIAGMRRCGFDAFELREDQDPQACLAAFRDLSLAYQPCTDGIADVLHRRRGAKA
jgi:uncharacterized protein (DUF934 family)